jgi:hypothetical protein
MKHEAGSAGTTTGLLMIIYGKNNFLLPDGDLFCASVQSPPVE